MAEIIVVFLIVFGISYYLCKIRKCEVDNFFYGILVARFAHGISLLSLNLIPTSKSYSSLAVTGW